MNRYLRGTCGIALAVVSICVAGCQSPQFKEPEVLEKDAFRTATGNEPIRTGDVLAIYVSPRGQETEPLTDIVDESGKIDVPPMGVWKVAGKTPRELKREFESRFAKPTPLRFEVKKLAHESQPESRRRAEPTPRY